MAHANSPRVPKPIQLSWLRSFYGIALVQVLAGKFELTPLSVRRNSMSIDILVIYESWFIYGTHRPTAHTNMATVEYRNKQDLLFWPKTVAPKFWEKSLKLAPTTPQSGLVGSHLGHASLCQQACLIAPQVVPFRPVDFGRALATVALGVIA